MADVTRTASEYETKERRANLLACPSCFPTLEVDRALQGCREQYKICKLVSDSGAVRPDDLVKGFHNMYFCLYL